MAYHQQVPGSPFVGNGDTTYTKVFVGGLAWETQSDTLRRYFEHFGDILEAVVIADKNTGRSKGYGFVTFRDPESARTACENPSPVIDGRRANCNLAALGRLRPPLFYGRIRPFVPAMGGVQTPRGHGGSPNYQQPNSYGYQPGFVYSPYGYTAYPPEYVYPQGVYNPYLAQHYYQIYGVPSAASSGYSYGQLGPPHSGNHGYLPVPGYGIPGQNIMQYGAPNVNGATAAAISPIQAPYPPGIAAPAATQAQIIVSAHSPQFTSSSDQTLG